MREDHDQRGISKLETYGTISKEFQSLKHDCVQVLKWDVNEGN